MLICNGCLLFREMLFFDLFSTFKLANKSIRKLSFTLIIMLYLFDDILLCCDFVLYYFSHLAIFQIPAEFFILAHVGRPSKDEEFSSPNRFLLSCQSKGGSAIFFSDQGIPNMSQLLLCMTNVLSLGEGKHSCTTNTGQLTDCTCSMKNCGVFGSEHPKIPFLVMMPLNTL